MQDFINGRCGWCGTDELYVKYHDEEWGKPVTDDKTLFEFLVLESAQAGPYRKNSAAFTTIRYPSSPTGTPLSIIFSH